MGVFSVKDLQRIQTAGTRLVRKVGGLVPAERQIHLIRFRELEYDREFVGRTQHFYPHIAEQVMLIYTNGDSPKYSPAPPKAVPDDGYHHNSDHTAKILESAWGGITHLKAFARETTSISFGERAEYRLTDTAPRRLPDRAFIDKSRTISDLRRINLFINAVDFCPIR